MTDPLYTETNLLSNFPTHSENKSMEKEMNKNPLKSHFSENYRHTKHV